MPSRRAGAFRAHYRHLFYSTSCLRREGQPLPVAVPSISTITVTPIRRTRAVGESSTFIGPGPSAYSHTPTEWRQTFAEAQLPYAKIMGCVQSLVHAGSLALKNQLRRYEVEIKPARKPNLSNGRDKSASNYPLIISYRSISI